jgi:hypothetical protein
VRSGDENSFATYTMTSQSTGYVTLNPLGECSAKVSIVNSLGLTVLNLQSGMFFSTSNLPFDLSNLASGIYWISVECGTQRSILQVPIIR